MYIFNYKMDDFIYNSDTKLYSYINNDKNIMKNFNGYDR